MELYQAPWNFLALPADLSTAEKAKAWVLPIPYEATTSYGTGTRNGPAAILAASRQVELFDREFGCEPVTRFGVHTLAPLAMVYRSPETMLETIETAVISILSGQPAPQLLAVLGGEHSISAAVLRALAGTVAPGELVVVQIDAHADLRDSFDGSPSSHACAARRMVEVCPVVQIGIRNLSEEEERFRRASDRVYTVFAEQLGDRRYLDELAVRVRGKTVYLTIDLDGLDPSIMPAVGTPEPEGLSWSQTLAIVRTIVGSAARLAACDVVELAPIPGLAAPDFLAAKLLYKVLSLALLGRGKA
jgi:agmatinase